MLLLLFVFSAGIYCMEQLNGSMIQPNFFLAIIFLSAACLAAHFIFAPAGITHGMGLMPVLFCLGMLCYSTAANHHWAPAHQKKFTGIALSECGQGANSYYLDTEAVYNFCSGEDEQIRRMRIRLYTTDASLFQDILPGDSIMFSAVPARVRNRSLPGCFRYDKYLNRQYIWHTAFVDSSIFRRGGVSDARTLQRWAAEIRKAMIRKFTSYGLQGEELAVIAALSAGETLMLEEPIRDDYASAGTLHVLAVSGLHVGILYLFLSFILFNRYNTRLLHVLRFLIILSVLWTYALVTGLSPSVIRATTMFSLFHLGKSLNKSAGSLNILATSAMVLLALDPMQLFIVGFQFSYLAVGGILLFQSRLEGIFNPRNLVLRRIWQLTTVSISAQIFTFPLTLYYFHQYPVYSLLANLFVIPMVWIIMIITPLFFIFLPVHFPALAMARTLEFLLRLLNSGVHLVAQLPGSVVRDIRFNIPHLVFGFLMIYQFGRLFTRMQKSRVYISILAMMCIALMLEWTTDYSRRHDSEFILYNTRSHVMISLGNGKDHMLLATGGPGPDSCPEYKYIKPFLMRQNWIRNQKLCITDTLSCGAGWRTSSARFCRMPAGILFEVNDSRLCLFRQANPALISNLGAQVLIIDRHSGYPPKTDLLDEMVSEVVVCGNAYYTQRTAWEKFCKKNGLGFMDVSRQGFFSLSNNLTAEEMESL